MRLEIRDQRERPVRRGLQVQAAQRELQLLREPREPRAQLGTWEPQALQEQRELRGQLARPGRLARLRPREPQVLRG